MTERDRPDDRGTATDVKFYLPAGSSPSLGTDRIERLWARLFNHGIETPP